MSNYMSVGAGARVGYGFDKNRTKSRLCNLCVYCWEGFKKMFLKTKDIVFLNIFFKNKFHIKLYKRSCIEYGRTSLIIRGIEIRE